MGFVVLTTQDLKIKKVLYNEATLEFVNKDRLVTSFVDENDKTKLLDFIKNINKDEAEFGLEVHLVMGDKKVLYNFSGIKINDKSYLILANKFKEDIINYYDHFMKINSEYLNKIRSLLKKQVVAKNDIILSGESADLYNKISQINNELTNVQRKLTKTNKELEWQKERYFATLKSIGEGVIALQCDNEIRFVNQAAYNIFNTNKNLEGKYLLEQNIKVFDENNNDIFKKLLDKICKESETIKKEDVKLISFGKETPIDLTLSPIESKDNNLLGIVMVISDITLKKKHEEKLQKLADTDRLTDIMNRRMGLQYLDKQVARVKRENISLTVCFIDVNGLKNVNDTYGHNEGDKLLKIVANILKGNIRETDAIARLGGDEFLLILSDFNKEEVSEVWNRIEEKINIWNKNSDKPYNISLSRGFAQKVKGDGLSSDKLIEKADKKMYEDKEKHYKKKNKTMR
ncbi:MAG: diguanylate cyclase [Halanaerobiales bacterium]|nr:diguanylate cyclase [Halanaerobiales bacterium]